MCMANKRVTGSLTEAPIAWIHVDNSQKGNADCPIHHHKGREAIFTSDTLLKASLFYHYILLRLPRTQICTD